MVEDASIALADFFALDAVKYKADTWDGSKSDGKKSAPRAFP